MRVSLLQPRHRTFSLSTAAVRMVIDVPTDLCPSIEGTSITTAPTVAELHSIVGPPSRISEPATRAPVGHRNNHFHVYDAAGVAFQEHHYTRRIAGCRICFQDDPLGVRFAPHSFFSGTLRLGGRPVTPQADLKELVHGCGIKFEPSIMGWLVAERGDFSAILTLAGAKLPSGRRSSRLQLVSLELSWPHDPWRKPEGGG